MINVPDYKILKKIGSGGMGDVYLAEHGILGHKVAIKSLHNNLVRDENFILRFKTEAKILTTLDHPNIVRILDFKEKENGLFIIMEFVEGQQLDEYINKVTGPIVEKDLIPLFTQMLEAIAFAHAKGLVHRDIKPSNVIISDGKIKILDFGIAKDLSEDSGLTNTGVQVGTVYYMSPEQVNAEKIDKLTDIYSLGVTLFYMAVGKPPYENSNAFKIGIKIISETFPEAKNFYPGVSEKIETIISKATQKKKKDRYQSCEEFKKDLSTPLEIVSQKNISKPEKTRNLKKVSLILFLGALLSLGICLVVFYDSLPPLPSTVQNDDKLISDGVFENDEMQLAAKAEEEARIKAEEEARIKAEEEARVKAEEVARFKAEEEARVKAENNETSTSETFYYNRGVYNYKTNNFSAAIKDFNQAINLNPNNASYYDYRGNSYYYTENYSQSITDFTNAINLDPNNAHYYNYRGASYYELENYSQAITDHTKAINLDPNNASYYDYRGSSYYNTENYSQAITDFTKAINLDPNNASYYIYGGASYYELENYSQAITDFTKAINLDPNNASYYDWRGRSYYNTENYSKTITDFTKAINLDPNNASYYDWRGSSYYNTENYSQAITDYTKAINLDPNNAHYYNYRGVSYYVLENYSQSITDYTKAINLDPNNGTYYYNRAYSKELLNLFYCNDFRMGCVLGHTDSCEIYETDCQ